MPRVKSITEAAKTGKMYTSPTNSGRVHAVLPDGTIRATIGVQAVVNPALDHRPPSDYPTAKEWLEWTKSPN